MANIDDGALAAIATSGLCTLGAQLVLWIIFAKLLGPGPWRDEPGFTAHQIICLPLMAVCAAVGVRAWLSAETADGYVSAEARVLGIHPDGRYLSHLIFGELLFWDIPTGLLVASLREPVMVAHHIGMAFMSAAGVLGIYTYYGVFFFGFIEVSGVFLSLVDLFHPKHKAWAEYARATPALSALNAACRFAFLVAYISANPEIFAEINPVAGIVRAIYFPIIAYRAVIDAADLISSPPPAGLGYPRVAIGFVPAAGVLFSVLQLYWGVLLLRMAAKALKPTPARAKAD